MIELNPEDFLCDRCLFTYEASDTLIVDDFCDRCKLKMLRWLVEGFSFNIKDLSE